MQDWFSINVGQTLSKHATMLKEEALVCLAASVQMEWSNMEENVFTLTTAHANQTECFSRLEVRLLWQVKWNGNNYYELRSRNNNEFKS